VIDQFSGHLAARREQVGERRAPDLQDRVGFVEDVHGDRAVVSIDNSLHAVAHIVQRRLQPSASIELRRVGSLAVGIATAGGVPVDDPHHSTVDCDRVRVTIESEEGCQFLHALAWVALHQQLRVVGDCTRSDEVVIQLGESESEPS